MAEYCARCKRRMVVAYHVPEDVKRLVLLNRWKSGVCGLLRRARREGLSSGMQHGPPISVQK
jgi:hypothetical protein